MRRFTVWMLLLVLAGFCADRDLAGRYAGEWKSETSGSTGTLHMSLTATADGTWQCDASFTIEGGEFKTATHQFKLQDSKLDGNFDFEYQGATLRSHMTAEWNAGVFKGRYETSVAGGDPVDIGTWNASLAK